MFFYVLMNLYDWTLKHGRNGPSKCMYASIIFILLALVIILSSACCHTPLVFIKNNQTTFICKMAHKSPIASTLGFECQRSLRNQDFTTRLAKVAAAPHVQLAQFPVYVWDRREEIIRYRPICSLQTSQSLGIWLQQCQSGSSGWGCRKNHDHNQNQNYKTVFY